MQSESDDSFSPIKSLEKPSSLIDPNKVDKFDKIERVDKVKEKQMNIAIAKFLNKKLQVGPHTIKTLTNKTEFGNTFNKVGTPVTKKMKSKQYQRTLRTLRKEMDRET